MTDWKKTAGGRWSSGKYTARRNLFKGYGVPSNWWVLEENQEENWTPFRLLRDLKKFVKDLRRER